MSVAVIVILAAMSSSPMSASPVSASAHRPTLAISGTNFTLDDKPAFLLGASYYGGLGVEDEKALKKDLDDLKACGFNWIRVWATWSAFDNDVSAVAGDGSIRQPYMQRLKDLCRMAGKRGMVVDVTVTREKGPVAPSTMEQHRAVMKTLAEELKPYRNVYFDIGNERNVGDARHVPMREVGELVSLVKEIDPKRLCTASQGDDIPPDELIRFIDVGKVDFVCPHRPRNAESSGQTASKTREYFEQMKAASRVVPVLYQEPFRRDYGPWQPTAADFEADLNGAREGGAAGWCFHNGSVRKRPPKEEGDGRPRRSFDMRPAEGRMFDQLDAEERAFVELLKRIEP